GLWRAVVVGGRQRPPPPPAVEAVTEVRSRGLDGEPCRLAPRGCCGSAGLAVGGLLGAAGAELGELQPVRVVPAVLLGDVVAVLAVDAGHRDLGADVGALA